MELEASLELLSQTDPQTFDAMCEVYGLDGNDVRMRAGQKAIQATEGLLD